MEALLEGWHFGEAGVGLESGVGRRGRLGRCSRAEAQAGREERRGRDDAERMVPSPQPVQRSHPTFEEASCSTGAQQC